MVILHIAKIDNSKDSGVFAIVPEYIREQQKVETVALFNFAEYKPDGISNFFCGNTFDLEKIDKPFNKPDLLVFHEVYKIEYIKAYKEAIKNSIPYVIVPHGSLGKEAQNQKMLKKYIANIIYFNRFIKNAKAIQYLSNQEQKGSLFSCQSFVVSNPCLALKETYIHEDKDEYIHVVYIGRYAMFQKGLDILIEAISLKCDEIRANNIVFDLYGSEWNGNKPVIEKMVSDKNISDICLIHGPVYDSDKKSILSQADAFVQTSRFEGMSLGVLEAMAYNIPCLVTSAADVSDGESHYGWIVSPDAKSVANGISKLISDKPFFNELGNNGRRYVKENMSSEIVARKMLSEYQNIVK